MLGLDFTDISAFEVLGRLLPPAHKREVVVVVLTNQHNEHYSNAPGERALQVASSSQSHPGYLLSQVIQEAVHVVGVGETRPS